MSHDFMEAALLRRGGWAVHMGPGLPGSYEERPPSRTSPTGAALVPGIPEQQAPPSVRAEAERLQSELETAAAALTRAEIAAVLADGHGLALLRTLPP